MVAPLSDLNPARGRCARDRTSRSPGPPVSCVSPGTVHISVANPDHVPDGLDSAAALGLAEVRHVLLEVGDQVFGVHAAPIIAVYGVNDMAPWRHMYVNPGLTEP